MAPFHWFLDHLMCYEGVAVQSNFLLNSLVPTYYPSHPILREIVQRVLTRWPRSLFRHCPPGIDRRAVVYVYAPGVERKLVLVHTDAAVDQFPQPFDTLWFDRHRNGVGDDDDEHSVWLRRRRELWRRTCDRAATAEATPWSRLVACYEQRIDHVRSTLGGWSPEFLFYGQYIRACAMQMQAMEPYRGETMRFLTTRAPFRDLYTRTLDINRHAMAGTVPRHYKTQSTCDRVSGRN